MSQTANINNIIYPLHLAIDLALESIVMKSAGIEINVPYIVGRPGGGKTKMFAEKVSKKNWGILCYTPGLERKEKFGGIPDFVKIKGLHPTNSDLEELYTVWSVPQMLADARRMSQELDENGNPKYEYIVIHLDDWHLCTADIQQIGFEVFTHYSLNGHVFPKNVAFVLSGNEKSTAGAKVQLSAIRNRCTLYLTEASQDYWLEYYAIPNNILDEGCAYFSNPDKRVYFHQEESATSQFGSPRSWTSAFNKIKYLKDNNIKIQDSYMKGLVQGDVGPDAAQDFWNYYKIISQINTKDIFDNHKWTIPTDMIMRFAFGSAIAIEFYNRLITVFEKNKKKSKERDELLKNLGKTFSEVINDLYKTCPEIAVLTIKQIYNKKSNAKFNLKDGSELLGDLVAENYLNIEIIKELANLTKTLRKEMINA